MEPIPVVWHGPEGTRDPGLDADGAVRRDAPFRRAASLASRSQRSIVRGRQGDDGGSDGELKRSTSAATSSLRRARASMNGGSFASGAGTVGPHARAPVEAFHERSRSAEASLTEKQRRKLSRSEAKEGKKVAKIIRAEGKIEQQALDVGMGELVEAQRLQKSAIKDEAKAGAAYAKALKEFRKVELEFFAMRAKYERAQADLQAHEDARDASRSFARETTEMLQDKNREIEWLRAQKAVDDRERAAKIRELTGKA
ncbi:uncharacterized protein BXZ73DRAFT_38437 [Epithele typhae]|uniref:uncharacterized protein n=1 Tax=Epithele typhae TaxID=378194 RepID=UPI00200831A8|nr:uncharacterized protein BXZ73DRAFT_38437 [Epithele typhae]KAH9945175.1 hypothetical protein BXZ73DRAFT_38437 [Epithele typhae]